MGRHTLTLAGAIVGIVSSAQLYAQNRTVFETPLKALHHELTIDNASIEIEIGDDREPTLRATATEDDVDLALALEVGQGGLVVRSAVPELATTHLSLSLWASPEQTFSVKGRSLELSIAQTVDRAPPRSRIDGPAEADAPPAGKPPAEQRDETVLIPLRVSVADSSVTIQGVAAAELEATDSDLSVSAGRGLTVIRLDRGSADIRDHLGMLDLDGHNGKFTVANSRARIEFRLEGGSLFAQDGVGAVSGEANEAFVQIQDHQGPTSLRGTDASYEFRGSGGMVTVEGKQLDVIVERSEGPVTLRLSGGSVRGDTWNGNGKVSTADGTTVDLEGVRGQLSLTLEADCSADVSGVGALLQGTIRGSRLTASDISRLAINAESADVDVSYIDTLDRVDATDSQLTLDLREIQGRPALALRRGSRVSVQLPMPCQLRTMGPGSTLGTQVTVYGCEHRTGNQRWGGGAQGVRALDGSRPVLLTVTLSEDSTIEVEGVP